MLLSLTRLVRFAPLFALGCGVTPTDVTEASGTPARQSPSAHAAASTAAAGAEAETTADAGVGSAANEADAPPSCAAIRATAWSETDSQALVEHVIAGFVQLKRDNDALVEQRGIGAFVGSSTETWLALDAGDEATATALVAAHAKPGYEAASMVTELAGTSCIGRVYRVLADAYAALGRSAEWDAIETCGRASQSDGLHVQDALVRSGWQAPALALVTDVAHLPGSTGEVELAHDFLQAADVGSYYGVRVSGRQRLQNFLPSPGSSTPRDTSVYSALSTGTYLAFATLRAGYHVPLVVPGRLVPETLAPAGDERWRDAQQAGEPFVLESHASREAWDATNLQIRPLTEVLEETFQHEHVYSTGTLLFAPNGTFSP